MINGTHMILEMILIIYNLIALTFCHCLLLIFVVQDCLDGHKE